MTSSSCTMPSQSSDQHENGCPPIALFALGWESTNQSSLVKSTLRIPPNIIHQHFLRKFTRSIRRTGPVSAHSQIQQEERFPAIEGPHCARRQARRSKRRIHIFRVIDIVLNLLR